MRARRAVARRAREAGTASIELVSFAFVLVLVAIIAVQGIVLTQATSVTQQAARDGARAPSLGRDVRSEVEDQIPDSLVLESVRTSTVADSVRVEVTVRVPFVVPGAWSSFIVTRDAVMPR